MSRFFGEGEDVEQVQAEQQSFEEAGEPKTLTVSANDFSALEERVLRAVELVKRERLTRAAAEQRASEAESQLIEQAPQLEHLQKEVNALRTERDYVRQRVERLLGQLDALEL
ncbi:MAG: hypothetical protein ABSD67_19845 [Terracidiphilus sp.]|jgi:hypothetical protein